LEGLTDAFEATNLLGTTRAVCAWPQFMCQTAPNVFMVIHGHLSNSWAPALMLASLVQERCAIAKMTARCADKSKQTVTSPPKITWLSVGWPLGYEERRCWANCSCN